MAEISSRTVAHMMGLFPLLGCYDPTFITTVNGHEPLVTASDLKRALIAANFDYTIVKKFEALGWDFQKILPELHDHSFRLNFEWPEQEPEYTYEYYLVGLANGLVRMGQKFQLANTREFCELIESLHGDGFVDTGTRLVEADTTIVDVPAELTLLERAIQHSKHDDKSTLLHHYQSARREYDDRHWGLSMGEWRKFFEEVVRGVWRFTRLNNHASNTRIEKPPFKNVFEWLLEFRFFTQDEKEAYGSAWKFLSAGSHPGIRDSDSARFSMILALTLCHACLLKLENWNGTQFSA